MFREIKEGELSKEEYVAMLRDMTEQRRKEIEELSQRTEELRRIKTETGLDDGSNIGQELDAIYRRQDTLIKEQEGLQAEIERVTGRNPLDE